jgi:4-hydroxy-tetrahydrodipicolinate reductase
MQATDIVVMGARGRMGQMVLAACSRRLKAEPGCLRVIAGVEAPGQAQPGEALSVEGLQAPLTDSIAQAVKPGSVIIDFTSPQASLAALEVAVAQGAGHVLCTTGLSEAEKAVVRAASQKTPVLLSPNMSSGVTLMFKVAEMVAKALGDDFDVEIVEAHHNQKKDSPSGTALGFAEAVARGHQVSLKEKAVYGREGLVGARTRGEIGIHAVRGGDIVGDHVVLFAGDGERIELKHMAHSRMTFAQGAVRAALWLKGRAPGLYTMNDVLGI